MTHVHVAVAKNSKNVAVNSLYTLSCMSFHKKQFPSQLLGWGFLFLALSMGLLSCSKKTEEYQVFREDVSRVGAPTEWFGWEYSYSSETGNSLVYRSCDKDTPTVCMGANLAQFNCNHPKLVDVARQRLKSILNWKEKHSLAALSGGQYCHSEWSAYFKNGDILVYGKNNMDNIVGFQYERTVLGNDWQLYRPKH